MEAIFLIRQVMERYRDKKKNLYMVFIDLEKGVPNAESSRSVRGLGKGVSGKPYPRLCNARRPRLEPGPSGHRR